MQFAPLQGELARQKQALEMSTQKSKENLDFTPAEMKKLKESTQDFEALFILETYKAAEKSKLKTGWINGGQGEEMFNEMLMYERAKEASRIGHYGLAEMMLKQFTQRTPPR